MKKAVLLSLMSCLFACSKSENLSEDAIARNDFEMLDGWGGCSSPSLTKERAHSGKYSVKVDKDVEFSLGFDKVIWELVPNKPKKLKLTTWVYLPSAEGKAILGFNLINENNQDAGGASIKLEEEVKEYKEWVKIERTIDVPKEVTQNYKVRSFLWRASASVPVYMDDMTIEVIE
jgi:hypothetical protein